MRLTGEQENIIRHSGEHAKVSAAAGSGKTTAMIGRVGHLLRQGIAADKILVLMFNRSAKAVFTGRLHQSLQGTEGFLLFLGMVKSDIAAPEKFFTACGFEEQLSCSAHTKFLRLSVRLLEFVFIRT